MSQLVTDDPSLEVPARADSPGVADDPSDAGHGVRNLHTAAMMADVLGVPAVAIRHWIRTGLLRVAQRSGSVEWLDFGQLVVGRRLAKLLASGFSLREIDAKLAGLAPGGSTVAAHAMDRIIVDGRRLSISSGGRLLGAGGQLQLPFYTESIADAQPHALDDDGPVVVAAAERFGADRVSDRVPRPPAGDVVDEILDLADDLEAAGEYLEAAEALRAVLQAQGPSANVNFMLAELLYRAGDLTAARERYYMTIELDADHVRARTSLGCVLAELDERELALAALEGVLRQEPDYADAHWHIAGVLGSLGRDDEASRHLRRFLELAPGSPWAAQARECLVKIGSERW
jgi:hypothetical protein